MKLKRLAIMVSLLGATVFAGGCALFVVGAAAGAGAGAVSYIGNELQVTAAASVDQTWAAANYAMKTLQFSVIRGESVKDQTGGKLIARNAEDQPIQIQLIRQAERQTQVRIRVGTFDTTANRAAAQLIWEKMQNRL